MSTQVLKLNTTIMSTFDARKFGKWLLEKYNKSRFKSYAELGKAVGVGRATISRYILAGEQGLTQKASRPREIIVKKLAKVLEVDENEALHMAGYAIHTDNLIIQPLDGFDSEDIRKIKEYIELLRLKKESDSKEVSK